MAKKPETEVKPEAPEVTPEGGADPAGTTSVNVVVSPGMVVLGPKGQKAAAGATVAVPMKAFAKFPKMGTIAK
jgi:hypothetical protein